MGSLDARHGEIREAVRGLCAQFPAAYFREVDQRRGYPEEFVTALTAAGWLAALIPQEWGRCCAMAPRRRSASTFRKSRAGR